MRSIISNGTARAGLLWLTRRCTPIQLDWAKGAELQSGRWYKL
jgi:hypothetical protein